MSAGVLSWRPRSVAGVTCCIEPCPSRVLHQPGASGACGLRTAWWLGAAEESLSQAAPRRCRFVALKELDDAVQFMVSRAVRQTRALRALRRPESVMCFDYVQGGAYRPRSASRRARSGVIRS